MKRRKFISTGLGASLATSLASLYPWEAGSAAGWTHPGGKAGKAIDERAYLKEILYSREEVRTWLAGEAFPFSRYHSRFGWLLNNASFRDGIDDSISVYTYAKQDGERLMSNYREKPCRINTYGNSFTQCHQVSDHETWQEVLAAHLQEPVRNFGIGGWSVYQAYLRMLDQEEKNPAPYIIFNIYEDDHRRNLDAWRNIRVRKHPQHIESPLPHVKVDMAGDRIIEYPNPCPTPESVYDLCDIEKSLELFREDFVLQIMLAHRNAGTPAAEEGSGKLSRLILTHGIETRTDQGMSLDEQASAIHWEAAWFSSRKIVDKILDFARARDKHILWVLSYPGSTVARHLQGEEREDLSFLHFLREKDQKVVDLMEWHNKDFSQYKMSVENYMDKYFIGHYNPLGNFSCAMALKDPLIRMLDPVPEAYRPMGNTSL